MPCERSSPSADGGGFLTVKQIAERLQLAKLGTILGWIRSGELAATNVGRGTGRPTWRIAEADFARFLEARKAVPAAPAPTRRARRKAPERVTKYF